MLVGRLRVVPFNRSDHSGVPLRTGASPDFVGPFQSPAAAANHLLVIRRRRHGPDDQDPPISTTDSAESDPDFERGSCGAQRRAAAIIRHHRHKRLPGGSERSFDGFGSNYPETFSCNELERSVASGSTSFDVARQRAALCDVIAQTRQDLNIQSSLSFPKEPVTDRSERGESPARGHREGIEVQVEVNCGILHRKLPCLDLENL